MSNQEKYHQKLTLSQTTDEEHLNQVQKGEWAQILQKLQKVLEIDLQVAIYKSLIRKTIKMVLLVDENESQHLRLKSDIKVKV